MWGFESHDTDSLPARLHCPSSNTCLFYISNTNKSEKTMGLKGKGKRQMDKQPSNSLSLWQQLSAMRHKKNACDTELLQNFTDIILNPRPGISFSVKWNGFTFHKRNQFPRNDYLSLFDDRTLKSHSILHSSGWTQFSSSIRPPKTQSMWKFLCTHKV